MRRAAFYFCPEAKCRGSSEVGNSEVGGTNWVFYPAATSSRPQVAAHHSVTLTISGVTETSRPPVRTRRVSGVTEEERWEKNLEMTNVRKERKKALTRARSPINAAIGEVHYRLYRKQ